MWYGRGSVSVDTENGLWDYFCTTFSLETFRTVCLEREKSWFFFVKEGAYFRRIDFKFIRWIKAEGSYCKLFMDNARELLLSFNLTEITSYLPVQDFVRVHRSYIVNINSVDSFIGNMLFIGNCRIPISKSHKNEVLERLNLIGEVWLNSGSVCKQRNKNLSLRTFCGDGENIDYQ